MVLSSITEHDLVLAVLVLALIALALFIVGRR